MADLVELHEGIGADAAQVRLELGKGPNGIVLTGEQDDPVEVDVFARPAPCVENALGQLVATQAAGSATPMTCAPSTSGNGASDCPDVN